MTAGRSNNKQTSKSWCTPSKYANLVKDFFSGELELDPCSNRFSLIEAKIKYLLPNNDGLTDSWNYKSIFVNPPYGADRERGTTIKDWIRRCEEAHRLYNAEVLALIPVATNTLHWKKYIFGKASCICFLYDTRLKFMIDGIIDKKGAPMSCAMVYWGFNVKKFLKFFSPYGAALDISKQINATFGEKEHEVSTERTRTTKYRRAQHKNDVNQIELNLASQ